MKRVICDSCRAEVEPDTYGLAPTGWLELNVSGDWTSAGRADYCGPSCAIKALTLRVPVSARPVPEEHHHEIARMEDEGCPQVDEQVGNAGALA